MRKKQKVQVNLIRTNLGNEDEASVSKEPPSSLRVETRDTSKPMVYLIHQVTANLFRAASMAHAIVFSKCFCVSRMNLPRNWVMVEADTNYQISTNVEKFNEEIHNRCLMTSKLSSEASASRY